MKPGILSILIVMLLSVNSFCQKKINPDSLYQSTIGELKNRELDSYKALVETSKASNEDFKETVRWFIGGMVGFVILVLGSQIFYNVQLNTRKVEAIRNELGKEIQELNTKSIESIDGKFSEISKKFEDLKNASESKMNRSFEVMTKGYDAEMKLREKGYDRDIKSLEADIEKLSGEVWSLKGVKSNALAGFINSAIIEAGLKTDLTYKLRDILDVLKQVEDISDHDEKKIEELLQIIQQNYVGRFGEETHELKKTLSEKDIYSWVPRSSAGLIGGMFPISKWAKIPKRRGKKDNDSEIKNS
jgi:Asp-tRNA(Asn)/Glu-tRNA(Gln) amidotransferase C subunit